MIIGLLCYHFRVKALLLAAGRSTRLTPIPDKNLLKFFGVPLIEHQLRALHKAGCTEIYLVGGVHNLESLREIAARCTADGCAVTVGEQEQLELGMGGAVQSAENWIGGEPILVVSGNDIVDESAFSSVIEASKGGSGSEGVLLARKVSTYFPGGYLEADSEGRIKTIVEKPGAGNEPSDLVNLVVHYHPDSAALLTALESVETEHDDRYEVALQQLFSSGLVYRALPYEGRWNPVKFPWHIIDLMNAFFEARGAQLTTPSDCQIAETAVVKGPVVFGHGVRVFDNAVIIGPAYIGDNSVIATNAMVRESHIGSNCVIGFGSEVARSYLGDHVWTHSNYLGDSVIGNNVSFGAGTVTGNLRLDEGEISSVVKGERLGAARTKFGLVTGDDVRVGINTSFMPGIKIGSNVCIGAGIVVAEDVEDDQFVAAKWELIKRPNKAVIMKRDAL